MDEIWTFIKNVLTDINKQDAIFIVILWAIGYSLRDLIKYLLSIFAGVIKSSAVAIEGNTNTMNEFKVLLLKVANELELIKNEIEQFKKVKGKIDED